MAARRLAKQWDVWHRFSDFDALNEYVVLIMNQLPSIECLADTVVLVFSVSKEL